jgi:hypothetical protein
MSGVTTGVVVLDAELALGLALVVGFGFGLVAIISTFCEPITQE